MSDPESSDAGEFPGACDDWSLTKVQAEVFFTLGEEMGARGYHHDYETSRCMITGELVSGGQTWRFKINGAAKGYWAKGGRTRYFGCDSSACEPLVLIPHIGMNP